MKQFKKYFYFSVILLNLLLACKKEKDKLPPVIIISTPAENQPFNINENIHLTGTITDESDITNATVNLLNEQGLPVHVTLPIQITSSPLGIDVRYALDNIHLESGYYKICIFASDGNRDAYAYRRIQIIGVSKVVSKILVTTIGNSMQTNLSYVDTASGLLSPLAAFSGDHLASATDSYFQRFIHCGKSTGHFTGVDIGSKAVVFDVAPVISPPMPYFTGFHRSSTNYYVAAYNEQIKGYDPGGNVIYNAKQRSGYYAQHMCMNGVQLISEERHKITADKKLVCYYETGVARQSANLVQDVISFCEKDNTHVFVFGNKAGQGVIQLYDRNTNNLWDPYPYALATGSILCVLKLDADTYLIAHSNGSIYKYVYSTSSVTPYLNGYTTVQLIKEELANVLYVVEKNKISRFEFPGLKQLSPINSSEEIVDLNFLYNR